MRAACLALLVAACTSTPEPDPVDAGVDAAKKADFVEATIAGVARDFSNRFDVQRFEGQVSVHVQGYATDGGDRYPSLVLTFPGTVGRHACDAPFATGEVSIGLNEDEDHTYVATNVRTDAVCAIDVTQVDASGGRWAGTFSATLQDVRGEPRALTDGRFDVPAP